ncbi:MFS transporter [Microaerobacter geothermalis]|uniref:MFS transporter n=1 Tax=Microaerobacter geothermalis TaxID=674972 RepID=UPI001F287EAE|nr:MFS transporter [Microaerobacter geothermalis]MCF6094213.1 MFS transporter [Microaerobacter geothermalis]
MWKRNLYILCVTQFLVLGAMSLIIPFLPLYIQELGITSEKEVTVWSGVVFGVNFLSAFIFSPIWGNLADKYGRKIMLLRSGYGMAIVVALTGFAANVWQLALLRLLNGVVSGFIPASIALTATNTPKEKTGYALGLLQSGAVAGSIMGPFFGGLLAEWIGYRAVFWVTGALIFVAAVVVTFFVVEEKKPNPKDQVSTGSFFGDFKFILKTEPLLSLFVAGFLVQFAMLNPMPILPLFIQQLQSSGEYIAFFSGLVAAVTGLANMIASPTLGKWGDKRGSEKVLFYSLLGASLMFIPQALVTSVGQLIIFRFLLGLCIGGLLPSVNSLIHRYSPKGMESRTYGYSNSAIFLGNMSGPIFGGLVGGWIGLRAVFWITAVFLLINAIWIKYLMRTSMKKEMS